MPQDIIIINLGGINCYLIKNNTGFILVDTGISTKRNKLERELEKAGCKPGNLNLVILTHGDHDHAGNCQYLQKHYGTKIAMHDCDAGMVEHGDMGWNRKAKPDKISLVFRVFALVFGRSIQFDTFTPDIYVGEGYDLRAHGFDAKVLHLQGHSKGSIGIFTAGGDLFCGDLFSNFVRPGLHFFISDMAEAQSSVETLKHLDIRTVYPGHGKPFPLKSFLKKYR